MSVITKMRKQTCVYWAPTGGYNRNNDPILSAPVQMTCRWVDVHELFMDQDDKQVVSNAKVYTELDVQPQGYLKLGLLDDLDSETAFENEGVFRIKKFEKLPNFKNTEYLRTAML